MLDALRSKGCQVAFITLHVGIDTFRPLKVEDTEDHIMHGERFHISEWTAKAINTSTGRIIAIGTTTVRALESAALAPKRVQSGEGFTRLFITPGYEFKIIDALLTNFHLPKSTLLMMISAFASASIIRTAYQTAVDSKMKFYSFGDAMFIS